MAKMAIMATRTCALFGHNVILNGLSKTEYNGMKGTLGGYVADKERRLVYPIAGSAVEHELSLKPENIFIEKKEGGSQQLQQISILESCADTTNLVDTCDRLGSISMHEVAMSERDDVAKFLCKHSTTCLDVADGAGTSIRQMMCLRLPTHSKVCDVLKRYAAKQNMKEEEEIVMRKERCENCQKRGVRELQECSRCIAVSY